MAEVIQDLVKKHMEQLYNANDHRHKDHGLQIIRRVQQIGVDRPGDKRAEHHHNGGAKPQHQGLPHRAAVGYHRTGAEKTHDGIVAGENSGLINREPLAYDADGNTLDEAYEGILDNPGVCYVGADARQSGTFQGEIVAALDDHGDINGDGVINYIMIEGDPENIDAQYRTEFSVKALEDAGYEVNCLDDQVGNWQQAKGQELTANALTAHGYDVEVVFCNNDGMALGAVAAIEAAGRIVGEDIYVLGVDALEEAVQLIKSGEMTGTVLNDHIGQSHKAVEVAIAALNGEEIDNYYWVDYVKVDKAYAEANY